MKILLANRSDTERQLNLLCLDNLPLDFQVLEANDFTSTLGHMKNNQDIDLYIIKQDDRYLPALEIFEEVLAKNNNAPVIIQDEVSRSRNEDWGRLVQRHPKLRVISDSLPQNELKNVIWNTIKSVRKINFDYVEEQYQKVRLVYFLRFNKVLCDVFVKIGDEKYIKIINKGDVYTREDFQKYTNRKIEHLYIRSEDAEGFGVTFAKTPFLVEDKNLKTEDVEAAISTTVEIIHDIASGIGISEQILNLVDYSIFQLENQLKKDTLGKLLLRQREKKNYLYDHSYLVAYMSNNICLQMDWCSDETRNKLTFAAMLMDITLNDPDLALAYDLNLPSLRRYSQQQIDEYKQHPFKVAELIKNNDQIPMNVEELVVQHHEKPDGTGFPRGLSSQRVTPLSATLIVAHNFVNELYIEDFNTKELLNILSRMKKKFSLGNYKGPVIGLIKCFEKEAQILLE